MYLPPFSFYLNPLEPLFNRVKRDISKEHVDNKKQLMKSVKHIMRKVVDEPVDVYF
jgi:hypothetical protein